jgi:hypothetical protein
MMATEDYARAVWVCNGYHVHGGKIFGEEGFEEILFEKEARREERFGGMAAEEAIAHQLDLDYRIDPEIPTTEGEYEAAY